MLGIHYYGVITCQLIKTIAEKCDLQASVRINAIHTVSHTLILVAANLVLVAALFKENI